MLEAIKVDEVVVCAVSEWSKAGQRENGGRRGGSDRNARVRMMTNQDRVRRTRNAVGLW